MKRPYLWFLSCLLFLAGAAAFAEERKCCWYDAQTGKQVPTFPVVPGAGNVSGAEQVHAGAGGNYVDHLGRTFYRGRDGCWYDAQTGKQVPTFPVVPGAGNVSGAEQLHAGASGNYVDHLGRTFYRGPCPSPTPDPTHTVKRILESIPINVGIGIGGGHTIGRDDHKGGHQHTSSTKTGKTVTAGCKCHPCTCSPCTCH